MVYTVKSTHGGHYGKNMMDPGAVGNGYKEAVLAQEINKKFLSAIKGSKDASDFNGTNQNQNLANIVAKMNQQAGTNDYAISHHFNAFNKQATGTEVWYYTGDTKGKELAEKLSSAISKALGITNRGAKATTDLYVVRNSNAHTVLIEWCFIDNANDMKAWKAKGNNAINEALKVLGYAGGTNKPAENKPAQPNKPQTTAKWIAENGTFILGQQLPLTVDYTGNGKLIANIAKGQAIKYDAFLNDGKYIWIRQKRSNGYGYMATGNVKNGKRSDYWGTFK